MAIQDSDPERRNLVITSLSFIVFYLAGGHIPENTLKLQIVNITFNNTHVLIITAWLMLAWFAIRYWQTHKGLMTNEIVKDTCSLLENKALINFVERVSGKKYRVENGFVIKLIQKHFGIWSIAYATIGNAQYNKKGKLYKFSEGNVERIDRSNP